MLIDVVMPQLGESVVEGVVVKWLVAVGDLVAKDQPLLEISTDKVDAEIPSPAAGRVAAAAGQGGETVPIQTVLAKIETDQGATLPAEPGPEPKWDEETEGMPGHLARKSGPPIPAPPRVEPSAPPPLPPPSGRVRITPVVARIVAEHRLDLSKIPGTGVDGRVTRKDVEGYLASGGAPPAAPPIARGRAAARSFQGRGVAGSEDPASSCRRRGPGRSVDTDPEEDRGAHGPEQADLPPRPHLRRGGHAQGGG